MTERLVDVAQRIRTVHQLSAVISAMRGIAAARAREARAQLDGIRAYARTIAGGIGHALAFMPEAPHAPRPARDGHIVITLCAEQGFAGAFSAHVLDAAEKLRLRAPEKAFTLFVIGDRGLLVAEEKGMSCAWSAPMISHPDQAPALASRIVDALYDRLDGGPQVSLLHALPGDGAMQVVEKRLVPFDFARFPLARRAVPPLATLPPDVLLARLVEEYVFTEVAEAAMLSFAAENEARMRAMIAAHTNVEKTLEDLIARSRQLRQEEITNEIVELAGGAAASAGRT
ncbi:F0F1 ATP synthase subunit gamma [Xanthobacter sediminis]